MSAINKKAKEKYWKKIYDEAEEIECKCGCGTIIKSKDRYGRNKSYVSGHNGRKYDDPKEHKRAWNRRNKKARYDYKKSYIRQRKITLIEMGGSKCNNCGLEFNGSNECCFDFHHIFPEFKNFSLNQSQLNNKSWKKILEEFKKCELLCANCHRIKHNNYD